MAELLVVGALHWDVVVEAPRLPRLDETLRGTSVTYRLGGKGGNQALAAAAAGARVAFAGRVGADDPGARMRDALARGGVDVSGISVGPGASGMSAAIVDATGSYGAVIVPGENAQVDPAALAVPPGCRIVLAQNELAPKVLGALPGVAGRAGAKLWLNAAPADGIAAAVLAAVEVLIVNRLEAGDLLGHAAGAADGASLAMELAQVARRACIVVTLGGDGVVFRPPGGSVTHAPARKVPVVSTHGAGDMFVGSLAAAVLRRDPLADAVAFAQDRAADLVSRRR